MASTNLWLRGARGKLAGASLRKGADGGTQIVPIVTPTNPKTRPQIYQRAMFATISQAYAAGKKIFNHSFEGKQRGSQNQLAFFTANIKMMRQRLSQDLDDGYDEYLGYETRYDVANDIRCRFTAPGYNTIAPNPYMVSQGTYEQALFTPVLNDQNDWVFMLPDNSAGQSVQAYARDWKILPGDTYTFLAIVPDVNNILLQDNKANEKDLGATLFQCIFAYCRLSVRESLSPTDTLTTYRQLFDIQESYNCRPLPTRRTITEGISIQDLAMPEDDYTQDNVQFGAIACIRAKENSSLRSTSFFHLSYGTGSSRQGIAGLSTPYVIDTWKQETTVGQSNLILEGGNI